jgi:hypothetical protein
MRTQSESFDAFSDRLSHTSTRFTRSVVNGARGHRTTLYIVAGVVGLFLFWHFFF